MTRKVILHTDAEDGGWVASVPSLPGCRSQGRTRDEALANLHESIERWFQAARHEGVPVPTEDVAIEIHEIETIVSAPKSAAHLTGAESHHPDWRRWFDWLTRLQSDPASVADDLTTPPSPAAISVAISLTHKLQDLVPDHPPAAIVVGPNGEIIIERRNGHTVVQYVIDEDLTVSVNTYRDARLIETRMLSESLNGAPL